MIPKWDFSLRLTYAIDIIGKSDTKDIDGELVLNQGSEQWCKINSSPSHYCEFERLFEQDLVRALSSSSITTIEEEQINVLFVKPSGMDGVIVSCRFVPPSSYDEMTPLSSSSVWVKKRKDELVKLVSVIKKDFSNDKRVLFVEVFLTRLSSFI